MRKRSSAGPPAGPGGSRLKLRALALLALPLLGSLWLRLPYAPLQAARRSLAGVQLTDRSGRLLYRVPGPGGAFASRLSRRELTPGAREMFVGLEDRRFFLHRGIDPLAVARAGLDNLRRGRVVSGASTITMQAARLLAPHRGGLPGKLHEALMALRLEATLSKEQILLLYLDLLPFGANAIGLGAAAEAYFDRRLGELSPAQLLLLATLPRAPAALDPFRHPEALRRQALSLASRAGVTPAEVEQALASIRRGRPVLRAPHFVFSVLNELPRLGASIPAAQELTRVVTTLDLEAYQALCQELEGGLAHTPALRNAAGLALDNASGEVLAWAGAPGFLERSAASSIDALRVRSPSGSTLKPFLYALALERGYTCASLLPDLSLSFGTEEGYRPENFDRRSRGLVRLRTALAGSLNVPAVYLLSRLGLRDFLSFLATLGLELGPEEAAGLGLGAAVGNAPVSLLELARAFSVFPRGGTLPELRLVRELELASGRRIPVPAASARRVLSAESAWLVWAMLSDPSARATGFGTRSRLSTSFPAMFKSGTAAGYHSLWCLGATAEHTVGVWAGNLDRRAAFGATGSSLPAAAVTATLAGLRRAAAETDGRRPSGLVAPATLRRERVCALTGLRACPACPATRLEHFRSGTVPTRVCPVHAGRLGLEGLAMELFLEGRPGPRVLFPRDGAVFYRDPAAGGQAQSLSAWIAARPGETLEVRLNGEARLLPPPYDLELPSRPGFYRLEVMGPGGREALSYTVR
jgi:penicillin-binding protein 1C